jgi:hypothetical protein
MLLALLLASAGAGWVAVSMGMAGGLAGRLPSLSAPADQAAASWQERAADITEEASAFGRQLAEAARGAATALGEAAGSLATSASPAAKRTIEAARDLLRDPRHGPMVLGGLGLAAGLAFGVLLGRRRGGTPPAQAAPTPSPSPAPVRALSEPSPLPAPNTPAPLAVPPVVPLVVPPVAPLAAPLLAGTVAHEAFAAADPPPPPAAPTPGSSAPESSAPKPSAPAETVAIAQAEDDRAALISAIVTIFEEEALRDSGADAPARSGRRGDEARPERADAA